ncbi:TfpX/TfpZ family type IV pilin accessory protein [Simplicispira piscis]
MTDAHSAQVFPVSPQRWLKWLPVSHLLLSLAVASGIALLVTVFWFPSPYHLLGGGMRLFWVMLGVDMVCGPLLTLILIRPGKTRRALAVDLAMIVCLQWGALAYGVHALALSRPLAVVYEVDRFRVISYLDVPEEEMKGAPVPAWFTPWSLHAPKMLGLRSARGLDEKMASVEAAFQGVDAAQRPSRWQEYALSKPDILGRARPLEVLRTRYPMEVDRIDAAARAAGLHSGGLWLPLVGRRSAEWIALIDPTTASVVGYLPLDGFF